MESRFDRTLTIMSQDNRRNHWAYCIIIVYLAAFVAHAAFLGKTVYGDGTYYYAWLRSAVIDHDIDFRNDYGAVANIYPIGPAILWSPGFLWIHSVLRADGMSFPYQVTVGLMSVGYAIIGILLLWRLVQNPLVILSVAFATNLLFYGSLDTVNSHALSFLAATVFLTLWMQREKNQVLLGGMLGLLALIRPQDSLYGLLLLRKATAKSIIKNTLGFLLIFSLQLMAWQALYGKFWVSPYLDRGYGFDFLHPHVLGVLFSPNNGLFLWTPMALVGVVGLFFAKKYNLLVLFAAQLYLVASWTTWWQGASFSGRMFISTLPVLALGLVGVFTFLWRKRWRMRELLLGFVIPLSLINAFLIVYYLLTH